MYEHLQVGITGGFLFFPTLPSLRECSISSSLISSKQGLSAVEADNSLFIYYGKNNECIPALGAIISVIQNSTKWKF